MDTASVMQRRPASRRPFVVRALRAIVGFLAACVGLSWLGIQVQPAPFGAIAPPLAPPESMPLPAGLPAPVERFFRQRYGERIPVIRTAVVSGRGSMRPVGPIFLPMRFRFTHIAGQSYRHYIEVTLFGLPVLRVNEWFVDGQGRGELPWSTTSQNVKWDQGANLGMWFETLQWFPAALLSDPRVHWEPIDDTMALLVVPFGEAEERFVVRFDPASGALQHFEVMRYKGGEGEKVLYIDGIWFDDGRPWIRPTIDDIALNVDVDTALTAKGP
jgi:hypothetical protein